MADFPSLESAAPNQEWREPPPLPSKTLLSHSASFDPADFTDRHFLRRHTMTAPLSTSSSAHALRHVHESPTLAFCDIHVHRAAFYLAIIAIIVNVGVLTLELTCGFMALAVDTLLATITILPLIIGNRTKKSSFYLPYLIVYFIAILVKLAWMAMAAIYAVYHGLQPGHSQNIHRQLIYICIFLGTLTAFAFEFYFYGIAFKSFLYLKRSYTNIPLSRTV